MHQVLFPHSPFHPASLKMRWNKHREVKCSDLHKLLLDFGMLIVDSSRDLAMKAAMQQNHS